MSRRSVTIYGGNLDDLEAPVPESVWVTDGSLHVRSNTDSLSGASPVISEPHYLGHLGFVYHMDHKSTGLADGSAYDIFIKGAVGSYPHIHKWRTMTGAGDVDVVLYEGTTVSADGTSISVENTNRNSTNTNAITFFHTPTVTAAGTVIHELWVPPSSTGTGQSHAGANAEQGEEWILKTETDYLIRTTNNSGSTIDLYQEILFYEIGTLP